MIPTALVKARATGDSLELAHCARGVDDGGSPAQRETTTSTRKAEEKKPHLPLK
jgi:hypothetical protein